MIGQVLDDFVLVLNSILNARTEWVAQCGEQKSRDGIHDVDVGGGHHAW